MKKRSNQSGAGGSPARIRGRDVSATFITILLLLFIRSFGITENIETLAARITALNSQIAEVTKQCDQEKKINRDLASRASQSDEAMKKAYASAENLNLLNARMNQLQEKQTDLCEQWRVLYGTTVDQLLIEATKEKNPKKKGDLGKKLQTLQKQNLELCPDQRKSIVTQEWRSIRIESYDGPQEIRQKIQLLKDISREINIHMAQLNQQMQNFQKEKKTKERAEEFIQESTLFTDNVAIRRTGRTVETTAPLSTESSSGSAEVLSRNELYGKEQQEQFELQYHQRKADLETQQKDLLKKISEMETKIREFKIP
jgi:ribosomal protein S10